MMFSSSTSYTFGDNMQVESVIGDLPPIEDMMKAVQHHIYRQKRIAVKVTLNQANLNKELFLLEHAYRTIANHYFQ